MYIKIKEGDLREIEQLLVRFQGHVKILGTLPSLEKVS